MKMPIAAAFVATSLILAPSAFGQFNRNTAGKNPNPPADPNVAKANQAEDPKLLKPGAEIAAPAAPETMKPVIPLPTGPIEPYLITRKNGPFMVLAYTFRGPDAPRQALALTLELRNKFKLPAYILLPRKFPGRSNIRGVPPTAPQFALRDDVDLPELIRTLDEAGVLVGDEKTTKDSDDLLKKIKTLHPVCIDGMPEMWHFRKGKGLSRATRTTNPFVPAEELYPSAQRDPMIQQMNDGPHSIRFCEGRYTLQVASFMGRSTFDPDNDKRFKGVLSFKESPLATAHDDAERLAEALSKDKDIIKTGFQPYVYHDRFSSRVTIGSFSTPNDQAAQKLHNRLIELAETLNNRRVSDNMIVPATALMDLDKVKAQLGPQQSQGQLRAN